MQFALWRVRFAQWEKKINNQIVYICELSGTESSFYVSRSDLSLDFYDYYCYFSIVSIKLVRKLK